MAFAVDSRTLQICGLTGAVLCGCLGPNPLIDAGEDTDTSGDGDGDASGDGDGDGDTSGDGDGDTSGDGDGDGDTEPDTCQNGVQDGDETDLDCGGSCSPCDEGQGCGVAEDCVSSVCEDQLCQAPSCDDGVKNPAEVGVDCGGPCTFCEHTPLLGELDDYEGSSASLPQVAVYEDQSFALTYNGPMEAQARWFDGEGEPTSPGVVVDSEIEFSAGTPVPLFPGATAEQELHVLQPGTDPMSQSVDLFLVRRDPDSAQVRERINQANQIVDEGDLVVEGSRATLTWAEAQRVLVRRFDYDVGGGSWIDIQPFEAETLDAPATGMQPVLSRNAEGVVAVAWVRCTMGAPPCSVVVRRFDTDWIDPAPVVVSQTEEYFTFPQVAIADDGRVGVVWASLDIGNAENRARLLDADLVPEGDVWVLQGNLPLAEYADVAALSDGSFAFAWSDPDQSRVHLRRFIGPNQPKVPELGDEAPWPDTAEPGAVSLASAGNRVVVVWAATVDMVGQIQGQVLSF